MLFKWQGHFKPGKTQCRCDEARLRIAARISQASRAEHLLKPVLIERQSANRMQ